MGRRDTINEARYRVVTPDHMRDGGPFKTLEEAIAWADWLRDRNYVHWYEARPAGKSRFLPISSTYLPRKDA